MKAGVGSISDVFRDRSPRLSGDGHMHSALASDRGKNHGVQALAWSLPVYERRIYVRLGNDYFLRRQILCDIWQPIQPVRENVPQVAVRSQVVHGVRKCLGVYM